MRRSATTTAQQGGRLTQATTCSAALCVASDRLAGLPSVGSDAFEQHLAHCANCAVATAQLRLTVATLGSHPGAQVPESLRSLQCEPEGSRACELVAELPHLYSLANALDPNRADDLVQETFTDALLDTDGDSSGPGLAERLAQLAEASQPELISPVGLEAGEDPDADEPEVFYPDFYLTGPDAGAWVDPPVAWGESRTLRPEDSLVTAEAFGVVDDALEKLDPIDAALVSFVDIERLPFERATTELRLSDRVARERLARGRFAVRNALDRFLRS